MDARGIIFDIDHFAVHDGPGIRSVVYLKGCPLRCVWCHSPESQSSTPQLLYVAERCAHCDECRGAGCARQAKIVCGREAAASEIAREVLANKVFFESSGGGVTLSGGEVLFQPEFSLSLLEYLRGGGVHTVIETSGMGKWDSLRAISDYADLIYYDIKTLDGEKHRLYTGTDNKTILENLRKLARHRGSQGIILRAPMIPGYNDSPGDAAAIYALAAELGITHVHLLRYNPSAPAKYQWLGREYGPGVLERQSGEYIDGLIAMAPAGLDVKAY